MRRIAENPPAEPHDVVVVHRPVRRWGGRIGPTTDLMVGLLVDGKPLCIPHDADVTVGHSAGGFTTVTVTLIAGSVDAARLPKPKRKR